MIGDSTKAIPMVATRDIGEVAASALLEGPQGIIELDAPCPFELRLHLGKIAVIGAGTAAAGTRTVPNDILND